MYSVFPMPNIKWSDDSLKYVLCFFPFVGLAIGIIVYYAANFMLNMNFGRIFYALVMTIIPIVLTGGIHFDGFMDTADSISSYSDREKKLQILKDPHIGAFAVIWAAVYLMADIAIWSEIENGIPIISISYTLSRTLSALSLVILPKARKDGLASVFSKNSDKKTALVMILYALAEAAAMLVISPRAALFALFGAALAFIFHALNCFKNFGGITGDLAGFFLQVCELFMLAGVMISYKAR